MSELPQIALNAGEEERHAKKRSWITWPKAVGFVSVLSGALLIVLLGSAVNRQHKAELRKKREEEPRYLEHGTLVNWWDTIPEAKTATSFTSTLASNIRPQDYVGPTACRECHRENYDAWSTHPHRWMNAMADDTTVKGDFSGKTEISYLGGQATFFQEKGQYRMRLSRGTTTRLYAVNQTIGSRFFQYYVGKGLEGPELPGHDFYNVDHVLPFGYWLDEQEWVPTVHVHWLKVNDELRDEEDVPSTRRPDPFKAQLESFTPYFRCNQCHTTFALGDLLVSYPAQLGRHAPIRLDFSMSGYLGDAHPDLWNSARHPSELEDDGYAKLVKTMWQREAPEHAVTLGISCEACHLGCQQHAANKRDLPAFFPSSPHLNIGSDPNSHTFGRTHQNLNWACGRCHVGDRRQLAGGMATWNSTEYTDAMRGSCYSQLKCIDCHDPHRATGKKWPDTPAQDDQRCLKCHEEFAPVEALQAHTHHMPGSDGSRCMNCHMPRINEGLQDVVRTHVIFSPTQQDMIEANQPNACNLCHTDQPIDWTVSHLKKWYEADFSELALERRYPNRDGPVALGWLASGDQSVRLIAADALARTQQREALPQLMRALDDSHLLNRQFAQSAVEKILGVSLDGFGYRYYMTPEERREPLETLKAEFAKPAP